MPDTALLMPIEKIVENTGDTSKFLDEMLSYIAAAAILQEAGRLAGAGPISEENLKQAEHDFYQVLKRSD